MRGQERELVCTATRQQRREVRKKRKVPVEGHFSHMQCMVHFAPDFCWLPVLAFLADATHPGREQHVCILHPAHLAGYKDRWKSAPFA